MNSTFKDEFNEKSFLKNGYIILDEQLASDDINEITKFYLALNHDLENKGFYTSIWSADKTYRSNVNDFLIKKLKPVADQILNNYSPVFSNFMVKKAQKNSALNFHQDWSFSLPNESPAVNIWIPLVDTNKKNGGLRVVPKSHLLKTPIRARNLPSELDKIPKNILHKNSKLLVVKKGQAVLFHENLIHGSDDNNSEIDRVAVSIVMASNKSTLIHNFIKGNRLYQVKIDNSFFVDYSLEDDLSNLKDIEEIENNNTSFFRSNYLLNRLKYAVLK